MCAFVDLIEKWREETKKEGLTKRDIYFKQPEG